MAAQALQGNSASGRGNRPVADQGLIDNISVSSSHSCAITQTGAIQCWGSNNAGQLGDGTKTSSATPVRVEGISDAVAIAVYNNYSCALLASRTVSCWGLNDQGQGGYDGSVSSVPVPVDNLTDVLALSTNHDTTCALLANGTISCFGNNSSGRLGRPGFTEQNSKTPEVVYEITEAIDVAVAAKWVCVVLSNGEVNCWGAGADPSELNYDDVLEPIDIWEIDEASRITAGSDQLCVNEDVTLTCLSYDAEDEWFVPDGHRPKRADAVSTADLHRCVVYSTDVLCAGAGSFGQLGSGDDPTLGSMAAVSDLEPAAAVATSSKHTCALLVDESVSCWGNNSYGQLGDGTTNDSLVPVLVADSSGDDTSE